MVRSLQLEAFHDLSDIPLIYLNCDAIAIPFNDTVEYSPALLEVWVSPPSTCFLISYFLDIILMRNSTAVRCPPIVMSSPCTVATTSPPVMRPLHTHGHALLLVSLRPLSVDACSSSQFCAAPRVPAVQAVSQQSTHVFVSWLVVLRRQIDKHPSSCLSVRSTPSAHRPMPVPFPHVRPLRFQTARLSAFPTAVSTHTATGLACVFPSQPISRAH